MVDETKKEETPIEGSKSEDEVIKVEEKKKPDRKSIFLSIPLNIVDEDTNELILGPDNKPQSKIAKDEKGNDVKDDKGKGVQEIEKVSLGVKEEFLFWLDVQKWLHKDEDGNLDTEITRGDLLKKMIYDHPRLSTTCKDDGRSLEAGLFCHAKSYKETRGHTVEKAFKQYKNFDHKQFEQILRDGIKKCSGE